MDQDTDQAIRLIALARRQGASIRALAKSFGVSKSTMARWVQALEASQMGQRAENFADISEVDEGEPPQMGQNE